MFLCVRSREKQVEMEELQENPAPAFVDATQVYWDSLFFCICLCSFFKSMVLEIQYDCSS